MGKIKGQEPGHGAITHAGVGGQGVVVGQEMVAQAYHAQHTLVERIAGIAQAPYLAGRVGAVAAGEGQEGGILEHAGVILPVAQVVHAAIEVASPEPLSPLAGEEGTDVHRPVRATRGHEVQALGYLLAERFPGGMGIAIPGDGAETLLSGVAGAREVDHALSVGGGALVLIEPLGVIKGIEAGALGSQHVGEQLRVAPPSSLVIIPSIALGHGVPVRVERLGAVAPPSVKPVAEELAVGVVPVKGTGLGIESVVDGAIEHETPAGEVLGLRTVSRIWPNGNHQPRVQGVDGIGQRLGVWIKAAVHLDVPPLPRGPVVPVLHDNIQGHLAAAILLHHVHQLLGIGVPLL